MKKKLGTPSNSAIFSSVSHHSTMKIKAKKNWGLIKAGEIFSGQVVSSNGRIELDNLPSFTAHPILFLKNGKLDSPSFVLV